MRDTDYTSLRREFLGVGLTGAMVGLAGCSDSVTIKTGSDGNDESTETPDIDTARFSFSYDEAANQARIEFTGGAAIDAGNVQIRHDAGREVRWAELGSTTAGPDEDIEAGAVAVLGPEILNWEAPIEGGETIRLIYTGKETPATLERYTPPGETGTGTTVPASISEFSIDASSDQQLRISFIADKQLETFQVNITGSESRSLTMANFTEQQTTSGSFQYEASVTVGTDGVYRATLEEATDISGRDSTSGQRITDTTDLSNSTEDTISPRIDAFSIADPSSQTLRVSFDSSERLSIIRVRITGQESTTLSESDFTVTEAGSENYTYEATFEINGEGTFTAILNQASDSNGNNGADGQSTSVSIQTSDSDTKLSFEDGSVGDTTPPSPWYELDNYGGEIQISNERSTDGANSLYIAGEGGGTNDNAQRDINIAVDIDVTNVDEIRVDTFVEQNSNSSGELQAHLIEDGNYTGNQIMGWTQDSIGWHRDSSADVSDVTGERVFYLHTDGSGNRAYFDNIRFYDEEKELLSISDVLLDKQNQQQDEDLSYTFENGPEGWVFGKRRDADASEGTGSWSQEHGGSLRLHVNGAPETIMAWKEVGSLSEGTTITANYTPQRFEYAAAGVFLRAVIPGEGGVVSDRDSDNGNNPEQDGNLEIEIPRDLPANTQLEIQLTIWPGETTVYIQDVESGGGN